MRRYGHPKDINQTYLDRPGAYGIILLGKKILCTLQKTPEPELQLPGGGIDLGQATPAQKSGCTAFLNGHG